ncbi:MAG: hypothetical protein SGI91_19260 [Alphaproteobacteria bacterium]|nr:hypothetical protein [Alphaproteobacteria bacterium]
MQAHTRGHIRERDLPFADEAPEQSDRGDIVAGLHDIRGPGAA